MLQLCVLILCLGAATCAPAAQKFRFLDPKKTTYSAIRLGSSLIIDCDTTDASARVTLWKLKKGKQVQIQPSLNLIQSGQIFTKHNIALEDAGHYKCKAQDSMNTKITKDVIVIINTHSPGLALRPSGVITNLTGSTVSFTCEAVAGTIMWRHVPSNIQSFPKPSKYIVKNTVNGSTRLSILTLPNAQVSNSGIYECWLYHYDTTLFRNVDLLVKDLKKPTIAHNNTEIKTVKLGNSKHLNCEATGFPTPVISWEKDGNPISLCRRLFLNNCQDSPYRYQPRGMKIESARFPQDNATYTCVARNSAGVTRKDFKVVVEVKPVLDKSVSLVMTSLKITCHALQGNPPPKFIWSMQLYWSPSTSKPVENKWKSISGYKTTATVSSDGMTSNIHVPNLFKLVFFKCVAVNSVGKDSHTIKMMKYM